MGKLRKGLLIRWMVSLIVMSLMTPSGRVSASEKQISLSPIVDCLFDKGEEADLATYIKDCEIQKSLFGVCQNSLNECEAAKPENPAWWAEPVIAVILLTGALGLGVGIGSAF